MLMYYAALIKLNGYKWKTSKLDVVCLEEKELPWDREQISKSWIKCSRNSIYMHEFDNGDWKLYLYIYVSIYIYRNKLFLIFKSNFWVKFWNGVSK